MCVKPLCLLMSAQCLTCSLRKILFSVNLFVNLFIRQVCSFRLECFKRHFKWLFEFNSWSAALQCIAQLQISFVFSFSACHSLRNSKVVTVFTVMQLKNSKPVSVFAVRQFEVEQMLQCTFNFIFICLCTIYCAIELWLIIWICAKFYSASANCDFVAVWVVCF